MSWRETVFLTIGIVVILMAATALAQPRATHCYDWPMLRQLLDSEYGEKPIGGGFVSDEVVVQVLAAPGGKTFTIVTINTQGLACIEAVGEGWEPGRLPAIEGRS